MDVKIVPLSILVPDTNSTVPGPASSSGLAKIGSELPEEKTNKLKQVHISLS